MSSSHTLATGRHQMRHELVQIRRGTAAKGVTVSAVTDFCLERILALCKNDLELAVDALVMDPRPTWIVEFCGPRTESTPVQQSKGTAT